MNKTQTKDNGVFDNAWSQKLAMCFARSDGTFYQLHSIAGEPPYNCPYLLEHLVSGNAK